MEVNVEHKFSALHTAVFKRKEMIDAIMAVFQCEHDKAKRLLSVLINGGSIHGPVGWCAENGLNSQRAECTIAGKLHEECQEAIALFTEQFPDHKAKSKEVFPNKSLRQQNIAPIHFELERLENECIVPIEQTAQTEGWQIGSLIFDGGLPINRIEVLLRRNQLRATRGRAQSCRIVPVDSPLDSPASPLQLSVNAAS